MKVVTEEALRELLEARSELKAAREAYLTVKKRYLAAHRAVHAEMHSDPILTERQADVLSLIRQHKQNKEIAWDLHISERTVKFHVSYLLKKFGVGNRYQL